jgi:hypothetical protein
MPTTMATPSCSPGAKSIIPTSRIGIRVVLVVDAVTAVGMGVDAGAEESWAGGVLHSPLRIPPTCPECQWYQRQMKNEGSMKWRMICVGSRGRGGGGGGGREREQSNATLCVSQLPVDVADEAVRAHFSKFGEVAAMRVSRANKTNNPDFKPVAFVQMRTRGNAQAAFVSPDAVMGNRFVQLAWARYGDPLLNFCPMSAIASNV